MNNCRLAVIAPDLGLPSETFIHRHMEHLLPGGTTVIVRNKKHGSDGPRASFPCLHLGEAKHGWRWLYYGGRYALGLEKLSPLQVVAERELARRNVEVVLAEYLHYALRWLPVARRLGLRFFAHAHGYDVSSLLREPGMRERYRELEQADGIIVMSDFSRRRLEELGLDRQRIHVIPYGVDVPDQPRRRDEQTPVRCLAVGRMVAKKGPLLTLEAFHRAHDADPRLALDMVGSGELLGACADFVREHGLSDVVTLHGSQPNAAVRQLMQRADIFVQHSRTDPLTGDEEGLPVAILEAMAEALPIVSTRHAGIPEAVLEDVTGYLVDEGDAAAMAECLARLARDPALRHRFGQAGWSRARELFSWERERGELIRIMELDAPARKPEAGPPR